MAEIQPDKKVDKEAIKRELAHEIKSEKLKAKLDINDPSLKQVDNKKIKISIKLDEFNALDDKKQYEKIDSTLKQMYGKTLEVNEKYILKCVKLTFRKQDAIVYLPYNLQVEKTKENLIFSFSKTKSTNHILLVMILNLFLFAAITAAFTAVALKSRSYLNIDIDDDGVADINLDLNNDGQAEINVDYNFDKKPDTNIDYKGDQRNTFNIDSDNDGKPNYNLMNQDTDNDGVCNLNCDTDDDGWPNLNIDLDGDGIADTDIDYNKDGLPEMNIDTNGDRLCDLMCDTNNDKICDKYCYKNETDQDDEKRPGNITVIGDPNNDVTTVALEMTFMDESTVFVYDLFPDDQDDIQAIGDNETINTKVPDKVFTIENKSSYTVRYALRWNIFMNDYDSDNFKFKVASTNGGGTLDWTTAPKESGVMITEVLIPPKVTQKYFVSFKLQGVNGEQNYDQGKTFSGSISIGF